MNFECTTEILGKEYNVLVAYKVIHGYTGTAGEPSVEDYPEILDIYIDQDGTGYWWSVETSQEVDDDLVEKIQESAGFLER